MVSVNNKLDFKDPNKNMALVDSSIFYTRKNTKSAYNNKFMISAPTWNDELSLPDGSYNYFEHIIKKHETMAYNPPVQI